MSSRRESEHPDTRLRIAEARNRLSPIVPIEVGTALLARDSLAVFDQARTTSAGDYFTIQLNQPGRHLHHCMRNRNARLLMRPELLTRRKFFSRFLIAASAVAAIGGADALFLEPRNLVSEHIDIRLARLPEEVHGFRIAQISEIHFGPYMGKAAGARAAVGGIFPARLAGTDRGLCFPLFWRIEWSAGG